MSKQRNLGLDALRATAIIGVFFSHGVTGVSSLGIGVDLFFVLSGFLIGGIYFRMRSAGNFNLAQFWIARWWRTLPPYFATLAIFAILEHWAPTNPINWHYLLFLQTFFGIQGFGPSWSLCVEEHFYLTLPLVALATEYFFGRRRFLWLVPISLLSPSILRFAWIKAVGGVPNMPFEWYRMTPFHCDSLIAGVYMAYLYVERAELFHASRRLAWICAAIIPISMISMPFFAGGVAYETLNPLVIAVGFAGWLRVAYDWSWSPVSLAGRATVSSIRGIALTSYSIYLLHTLIFSDLHYWLANMPRGIFKSALILISAIVASIALYFLVERPSIITRNKYIARHKRPRQPAVPATEPAEVAVE